LKQDKKNIIKKDRVKCGKCKKKIFKMELNINSGFVEVACNNCNEISVIFPIPKNVEVKNDGK